MAIYTGIGGSAKSVSKIYTGVNGAARPVHKGYIGVDGVAKKFYDGGNLYGDNVFEKCGINRDGAGEVGKPRYFNGKRHF